MTGSSAARGNILIYVCTPLWPHMRRATAVGEMYMVVRRSCGLVYNLARQDNTVFERDVAALVNEERARAGLPPLAFSEELSYVARIKSRDMRDNNYFSHVSPVYGGLMELLAYFGVSFRGAGENIAWGRLTPRTVMDMWMDSPGHRANILNPAFNELGVGYAGEGAGGSYWTQIFAAR